MADHKRILIAAAVCVSGLLWLALAGNLFERIRASELRIREGEDRLAYQQAVLERAEETRRNYGNLRRTFGSDLEPDERLAAFIRDVEKWALEEELVLKNVRPLPMSDEEPVRWIRLSVEMEGKMHGIGTFLYKVLSQKILLKLERLRIGQKAFEASRLEAEVELALACLE